MKYKLKTIPVTKGLFATKTILRGETIAVIKGEKSKLGYDDSVENDSKTAIEWGNDRILEPGDPFKEINHSCNPNCMFREVDIEKGIVSVEARRKINKHEELRVDYGWAKRDSMPCVCGSNKCKGRIE